MWKELLGVFKKDGLCEEAFNESLDMLRQCQGMFEDAIASLWREGALVDDIYTRDKTINRFERGVRRRIVTHLAVSSNPDINTALVLTAIVIDMERIGDYTKNIVELAIAQPGAFRGGELEDEVRTVEQMVRQMFAELIPTLEQGDVDKARQILGDHEMVVGRVEDALGDLIGGRVLTSHSGDAVATALYMRYLKRVSAHLKNVATSVVNPYYRIGFREKRSAGAAEEPKS